MTRGIFFAIAMAAAAAGCAGFGRTLEKPHISLANIQVQESRGAETKFLVELRVTNPNDIDLNVRGVDCQIELNEQPFAYGLSNAPVRIPAMGSEIIPVTVYSSVLDMVRGLLGVPQRQDLKYRLKGKVRLEDSGWLPSTLPFESTGSLKDIAMKRHSS